MKQSFRSYSLKLALLSLLISPSIFSSDLDLSPYLGSENAQLGICGNMPIKRVERNCAQSTDFRQCLSMNRLNPLYVQTEADEKRYICINTSSTSGMDMIDEMIRSEENNCLKVAVQDFYQNVIDHKEFQGISQQFEESLGIPLKLNYAIDTDNAISSVALNLKDYQGAVKGLDDITINVGNFAKSGKCSKLVAQDIINKVSGELSKIRLKIASEPSPTYGEEEGRVFNAGRFSAAEEESASNTNTAQRSFASEH